MRENYERSTLTPISHFNRLRRILHQFTILMNGRKLPTQTSLMEINEQELEEKSVTLKIQTRQK